LNYLFSRGGVEVSLWERQFLVGYACGNEACVTIKGPAEQYSYYEKYDNPTMARNVGIVVGCSVGTLLACVAGYWANKEYNKNVEVGPRTGEAEDDTDTDTDDTGSIQMIHVNK
jgi:hypothetical protein